MKDSEKLRSLEKEAVEMLIAHTGESKEILSNQLINATVVSRDYSGSGFFTRFAVPRDLSRVSAKMTSPIRGVYAKISGLEIGVGFLLFLQDGAIDTLECYEYDSVEFPREITNYQLTYNAP